MTYQFTFGFFVTHDDGQHYDADAFEGILDNLMTTMVDRENDLVFDSSLGAALEEGYVDIEVAVEAESENMAAPLARDYVAEAIREIGGTPIGFFVFQPPEPDHAAPPQVWHERKSELTNA